MHKLAINDIIALREASSVTLNYIVNENGNIVEANFICEKTSAAQSGPWKSTAIASYKFPANVQYTAPVNRTEKTTHQTVPTEGTHVLLLDNNNKYWRTVVASLAMPKILTIRFDFDTTTALPKTYRKDDIIVVVAPVAALAPRRGRKKRGEDVLTFFFDTRIGLRSSKDMFVPLQQITFENPDTSEKTETSDVA